MTYPCTFKFDDLQVGPAFVAGEAEIEFQRDYTWDIGPINIESAYGEDGEEFIGPIDPRAVASTLSEKSNASITDEVAEAIYWLEPRQ